MEGVSKTKGEKRKRPSPIQTPKGKKPKKFEKQSEEVKEKEVKKQRKEKVVIEEEEVQEVNVKEGGVQYRSNLVSLVKLVRGIEFSKLQKEEIRKSPFGNLLLCVIEKMMDESYVKKSDFETLKLVSRYQGHGGRFKLGNKTVKITEKEMTLIFGLQSDPNRIRLSPKPKKPNKKFADRICAKTDRIINIGSLRDCFEKVVKKNTPQDAKDVARVLTLYLLATVFCPHTTSRLNWNYLEFVEDLEASTSYAWSTYITEYLINELDTKEPKNVGGCVVGLLYWLCEHTTLVKKGAPADFPRFNKWRLSDVTELLAKTPLQSLEPENVIESELVPTDEEQKLLQFVEVVKPESDDDEEAVKPADKEPSMEQKVENKERPTDAYSELQAENQMLRNEVKRLKEENVDLRKTISMLEQQRDDSFQQRAFENDTIADLGFEVETVHVEKQVLQSEKQVLQSEIINRESEIGTVDGRFPPVGFDLKIESPPGFLEYGLGPEKPI
ncbi:hypothetical protein Vadar_013190 [Vaccinium darrowii]|uniref:Uncharacterized protein n=1 Tax=Vaccinium darrowii TaxID=229202 RepID=A0ACB7Z3Y6_9ERIC|nr:hypothetical protein Vadar_013190 [Vaccinium darrowii]